ncbi:unnamed protein product [Diamesa serratosioi]
MPIVIKNPNPGALDEYLMIEIQGDLESRYDTNCSGKFVGDLLYNKYGHPILIVGHHILFGKEQKMEKPFVLLEKVALAQEEDLNESVTISQMDKSVSFLDSTINIENRTKSKVEYNVRALIKKKLIFKSRPRPIIANLPKPN